MEHALDTTMTVNGSPVRRRIPARQHLVDFLREELGLTGSHIGCEHGVCGACTVRVDGDIVRGCRSEEHTSELQSQSNLVCRLLLEKKKKRKNTEHLRQQQQ